MHLIAVWLSLCCSILNAAEIDLLLRGGTVYDGSGAPPRSADVAITGERIYGIGTFAATSAAKVVDISGLAVAPGFINVLSWATESLLVDGHSQSNIRQGVTLEVFGEGRSMGPLNASMREAMLDRQGELKFPIPWTTLDEYLTHLTHQGVATNVASFVGAATVRIHELGQDQRAPTSAELERMQTLVAQAMQDGALGVGSALIYSPGLYADKDELIALMQTASSYGGTYISHLRSEGNRLLEAVDELIEIAEASQAPAQIHHLKVSGRANWHKFDPVVARIEAARARGLAISANMYTYTAGSTGLDAAMPPWVQQGGFDAWRTRLRDPTIRARVRDEMADTEGHWENLLQAAGAENTLLVGFRNPQLRQYAGQTLADVARQRNQSAADTAIDLVVEDGSRVQVVYFLMSEDNVRKTVALPWVSFGSDAASISNHGIFVARSTHPRTYGNFARLLAKYVRSENVITLTEAIHRLTGLPARQLRLRERGQLQPGFYADLVVFAPDKVQDHATYAQPHQYSTGVKHVWVNGVRVLRNGEHTGNMPGQVVRGPGWRGHQPQAQTKPE
ncbi:MAG: D-aminoacylase [Pseudomonadota bacterium]